MTTQVTMSDESAFRDDDEIGDDPRDISDRPPQASVTLSDDHVTERSQSSLMTSAMILVVNMWRRDVTRLWAGDSA
jgi:hypothetical protein